VICDLLESPRLGDKQSSDGRLHKNSIDRTLAALKKFCERCDQEGIPRNQIRVTATAVLRNSPNAVEFTDNARDRLGLEIEILSSDREAFLSFQGSCPPGLSPEEISLIDIGGGSTEVALLQEGWLFSRSFPIGVVRLLEEPELSKVIDQAFAEEKIPDDFFKRKCLGVAGTAVTTALLISQSRRFQPQDLDGMCLKRDQIKSLLRKLQGLTKIQRKNLVGMPKGREDIIVPGLEILLSWMHRIDTVELLVSTRGLRYGSLMR
jgi:exopolyphosphatase/guanosine-5'-triphosphate,3'-diphosphate pyrophosphatase